MGAVTRAIPPAEARAGGLAAFAAYATWGLFPLYFHALRQVPAEEVLANRVAWSGVLMLALAALTGRIGVFLRVFRQWRKMAGLSASATLVAVNWGVFIWAVENGHALAASIGYYVNPLFSLLLGVVVLGERINRRQGLALVLVGLGVAVMGVGAAGELWLVAVLPITFGLYGLIRKVVPVDAVTGLAVETALLFPLALAWMAHLPHGGSVIAGDAATRMLLLAAAPVTAAPLILFGYGARRIRLGTLGLLQYITPTLQLAMAATLLGEPLTRTHLATFGCIWAGIALYYAPVDIGGGRRHMAKRGSD